MNFPMTTPRWWPAARMAALAGGVLAVLLVMTAYGGTASPGPLFVLGVGALAALLVVFGLAVWWLYFSPLPAAPARATLSADALQGLAILVVLAGLLFCTGAFWDEIWHRLYGVVLVLNDFWWRPHILMYGSMALMALFAVGGLLVVLRGYGGLREKFRAAPSVGLLGLTSAYLALAAPSDELWHRLYGLDITAWSLPHLMFGLGTALVMLAAASLQASLLPKTSWRGPGGLRLGEVLILILYMVAALFIMQVVITEWEVFRPVTGFGPERDAFTQAFWDRPEWMYPAALIAIAVFLGQLAVCTLRRAGVATLLALLVLGFRAGMLSFFDLSGSPMRQPIVSQLLILAPAVAIDAWYALRLRQAESAATLIGGSLAGAAAFVLISLPLLPQFLSYPRVNAETVPAMVGWGLLLALWSGWLGARLGGWVGGREGLAGPAAVNPRVAWLGAGALGAFVAFALFFILTAAPPA